MPALTILGITRRARLSRAQKRAFEWAVRTVSPAPRRRWWQRWTVVQVDLLDPHSQSVVIGYTWREHTALDWCTDLFVQTSEHGRFEWRALRRWHPLAAPNRPAPEHRPGWSDGLPPA